MYHLIKEFAQYNLQLNMSHQSECMAKLVWPLVAIVSDSLVMYKRLEPGGKR